jgi:uncharacterized membrane protein YphA (DoxX/SURF4 family)
MVLVKRVALWIVTILLAVVMVGPGMQKFTGPTWERMFRVWGYPDHFYLVIGALEVVCGAGLLIPKTASASGLVLSIIMIGAAITQRLNGARSGGGELVLATLLLVVAYARWPGILGGVLQRRAWAVGSPGHSS